MIFVGSSDVLANGHTSRIIEPFLRWLFAGISQVRVEEIHHLIRKAGHVSEYAVLSLLLWWALRPWKLRRDLLLALGLTAFYAATDEFHQMFVPSRGASVWDVLIDTGGAAAAMGLVRAWRARLRA